jgi:VIT1/CCC1 family predicted Fe2+/Mn2+ transporter
MPFPARGQLAKRLSLVHPCNMRRVLAALIIGAAFVCIVFYLGHHKIATPIPLLFLLPGIMAGAFVPGSGYSIEGDLHPWGIASVVVAYGTNIVIYGGLTYLCLSLIRWSRKRA